MRGVGSKLGGGREGVSLGVGWVGEFRYVESEGEGGGLIVGMMVFFGEEGYVDWLID